MFEWIGSLRGWARRCWDRISGWQPVMVLDDAIRSFLRVRGAEAAASMAYYALFSLFPLLLILIVIGSSLLESDQAVDQVIEMVSEAIPVSVDFLDRTAREILDRRQALGLLGLVGALWASSGVFTTLGRNINRAWPGARQRGFLRQRLVAVRMQAILIGLLLLSLFSTIAWGTLLRLQLALGQLLAGEDGWLRAATSRLASIALTYLVFLALYRLVPTIRVPWRPALGAALLASVAWELARRGFVWYLGSGWASYDVAYGSLGVMVALLFWIYLSGWIVLFGAHLCAAMTRLEAGDPGPETR